jgi:hypothetical protein
MTITRNARTVRRKATVLSNCRPESVALVDAGANQTPFRSVKSDVAADGVVRLTDFTSETTDIARIEFPRTFDESAVKTWLEQGGYGDYAISDTGAAWVVTAKGDTASFDGEPAPIDLGGVKVFVGKLPTAATAGPDALEDGGDTSEADAGAAKADTAEADAGAAKADTAEVPAAPTGEVSRKGFYDVANLAGVIRQLVFLAQDTAWDVLYKNTDPGVVAAIGTHARGLVEVLQKLTEGEVAALSAFVAAIASDAESVAGENAEAVIEAVADALEDAQDAQDAVDGKPDDDAAKSATAPVPADLLASLASLPALLESLTSRLEAVEKSAKEKAEAEASAAAEAERTNVEAAKAAAAAPVPASRAGGLDEAVRSARPADTARKTSTFTDLSLRASFAA